MRFPLWSKILGILLGILLSAGVTYAAVYVYNVSVPSSVSVKTETASQPGLTVSPTSISFGEIAPGQSTGEKSISITNVGDKGVNLRFEVTGLPSGLTLYVFDVNQMWYTVPWDSLQSLPIATNRTHKFYVKASENAAPGSYNFTIVIKEK